MIKFKLIGYFEDKEDVRRKSKSIIVEASDDETARKYATILWPDCHKISVEMLLKSLEDCNKEEYIKKEDVLKIIYDIKENKDVPKNYGTLIDIIQQIRNLPAEDVDEVKHGYWIKGQRIGVNVPQYTCNQCAKWEDTEFPYCTCGAKMDFKTEEEE